MPLGSSSAAPVMRPGPSFCSSGTGLRSGSRRSEFKMHSKVVDVRGAAVAVVTRIRHVLPVRADPCPAKDAPAVEALEDPLRAVVELPVAEEEALAAGGEIVAVGARKAVH